MAMTRKIFEVCSSWIETPVPTKVHSSQPGRLSIICFAYLSVPGMVTPFR